MTLAACDVVGDGPGSTALTALRQVAGIENGAMERHGLRVALIAERLARRGGLGADRDVLICAGLLHDVGLYDDASQGGVYTSDGADFARRVLGRHQLGEARQRLMSDAIERHHHLGGQWDRGVEVELIRRADLTDVSAGLIDFGAGRGWLRGLAEAVPRDGMVAEIGRLVLRAARERPMTLPRIVVAGDE